MPATQVTPRPKAKRTKRPPRRNFMEQCDKLFAKLVKHRRICSVEGCDSGASIQCAHIISRSYLSLRCDFDNAIPLCAAHHTFWTHRPLEWEEWVNANLDGRFETNKQLALANQRAGVKPDWRLVLEDLRARARRLGIPT